MEVTYDDEKNMTVIQVYRPDDSLEMKKVSHYDASGKVNNSAYYTADGRLESRETYAREFDPRGNWLKETRSKWNPETGRPEPVEVIYREITYY